MDLTRELNELVRLVTGNAEETVRSGNGMVARLGDTTVSHTAETTRGVTTIEAPGLTAVFGNSRYGGTFVERMDGDAAAVEAVGARLRQVAAARRQEQQSVRPAVVNRFTNQPV